MWGREAGNGAHLGGQLATYRTSRPSLRRNGPALILDLGADGNPLDTDTLSQLNLLLDEIEQTPSPCFLVTIGSGGHWCIGVNVAWVFKVDEDEIASFVVEVHRLYARFLTLPMVSIAAIQGNAVASGLMLALSHDFRVMRPGQGFLSLLNVDLGYPLAVEDTLLLRAKLPHPTIMEMVATGKRYDAATAKAAGLVDIVTSGETVLDAATAFGLPLARKNRNVIENFKKVLFDEVLRAPSGPWPGAYSRLP